MITLLCVCLQITTPDVVAIDPPASIVSGDLESTSVSAFPERSGVVLNVALSVDHDVPGTYIGSGVASPLTPGVFVDSWFLHLDPPGQALEAGTGSITFAQPVLALITQTSSLQASDAILGSQTTIYPGQGSEPLRGMDSGSGFFPDEVTLTSDRQTVDLEEIRAATASDQLRVVLAGSISTTTCAARPNSSGSPALLRATGSASVADNNLLLGLAGLPPSSFALMIASRSPGFVPHLGGGEGDLCLGGAIGRFTGNVLSTTPFGAASLQLDLNAVPQPTGLVSAMPGDSWYFQCWYRDLTSAGAPTSNLSEAVVVALN